MSCLGPGSLFFVLSNVAVFIARALDACVNCEINVNARKTVHFAL